MLYIWTKLQSLGLRLRENDRGATMVEYGLLVALIAILLIGAILFPSGALDDLFNDAGDAVNTR